MLNGLWERGFIVRLKFLAWLHLVLCGAILANLRVATPANLSTYHYFQRCKAIFRALKVFRFWLTAVLQRHVISSCYLKLKRVGFGRLTAKNRLLGVADVLSVFFTPPIFDDFGREPA